MALLRRCLLELRARQGGHDSHQEQGCVSGSELLCDAALIHESDTDSVPHPGPEFSTRRWPAYRAAASAEPRLVRN